MLTIDRPTGAVPGRLQLRPAPLGMPETSLRPPIVAESGDPFGLLRVVDLFPAQWDPKLGIHVT